MNKSELIETLSKRLGDRKAATVALDSVLEEIQRAVAKGDRVALTGFGVFEKRVRNARTARNPRTGEAVKVKKTSIPSFRAGQGFKDVVTGAKKIARAATVKPTRETATATTSKANGRSGSTGRQTAGADRQTATTAGPKTVTATAGRKSEAGTSTAGTSAAKKSTVASTAKKSTTKAPATKKAATRSASR